MLTGPTKLSKEKQRLVVLRVFPNLNEVEAHMEDPAFVDALQDLVRTLIRYSKDTGIPLDVMGDDNIVLTETEKGWRPRLLDPLPIDDYSFTDFGIAAHGAKSAKALDGRTLGGVYNGMNTVRVINALAILSGVPDRLIIEDLKETSAAGWREIMSGSPLCSAA